MHTTNSTFFYLIMYLEKSIENARCSAACWLRKSLICNILVVFTFLNPTLSQSKVDIRESPLVIPTYQVEPADKNPMFYTGRIYQGAQGHIYPHPIYDVLTGIKKDRGYKALYIDNEYTAICVLPELGGRIFSATDKTNGFDFFYHQHVIKPALIGMIGAWISGGVEWNIPDHHRATSQLPVDYTLQSNADGSKTIWVGETELSRGLKWSVGLTLYPGRSYIEATVNVINPTPFQQSFLYWANVSVHTDENYQVIFPPSTQFGVQHAKNEFTSWPIGSGRYAGIDRTGTDLSWWKNHPNPASIFAWNFTDDFLAGYDHKKEAGTVHVANHQVVTGKKFFLWGNNPEAKMWEKMLTDTDGQYLELMVGAYSDNQPDYSWIAPSETRTFKQYWYPIKKIGGVKNATNDAAINVERKKNGAVTIGLNTTAAFKGAQLILKNAGKVLSETSIDIDPATPYIKEFVIDPSIKDTEINVTLLSGEGRELVSYKPAHLLKQSMPQPIERPRSPKEYKTNEELYLTGLRIEQFRNATIDPLPYYDEALKRDSSDYRVNNILGIRFCKEGKFMEAEKYLERAVKRLTKNYTKPNEGESFYYLGIVYEYENRHKEAASNLWKSTWYNGLRSSAFFRLARLACLEKQYDKSLELVQQSIEAQSRYTEAFSLKAYLSRKKGNLEAAHELIKIVQQIDPLDHWAACENIFATVKESGKEKWEDEQVNEFKKFIGGNPQSVLELAIQYGSAGAYDEALQVLDRFRELKDSASDFPMLYYYTGFYNLKNGNSDGAKKFFRLASEKSSDYCFPFRLEEIEILKSAIQENPQDARAYYYLGNLLYYLNQKNEAITNWQHSLQLDSKFYLTYRNLGFAYGQVNHDFKNAIISYEKAININNRDARLFAESDVLKEQAGVPATDRLQFLEKSLSTVEKRDDAITRLVELYNISGDYDRALAILSNRHFHVWEGGGNIYDNFVDALLLRGIDKMKKKQFAAALKDFELASTYPENLEVGQPTFGGEREEEVNFFIAQAFTALKNPQKATVYYNKILQHKNADALFNRSGFYRGQAMLKMKQVNIAHSYFNEFFEAGKKQLKTSEGSDFFSKFGSAVSRQTGLSDNYLLLGLAYFGKSNYALAKKQFSKAIELNHNNIWARAFLNIEIL
ncbi:MAG: DUF5107 domain-containing protein [Ferruginibacter sp.]